MIVDADAHVIETEQTWSHLEGADVRYRPRLVASPDDPSVEHWAYAGKSLGLRLPTLSDAALSALSRETGRELRTDAAAREARDVELRLRHMDALGIDVQVLFSTLWIVRVTDDPGQEIALCGSWNRWMAGIYVRGRGRLRWCCVVPAMTPGEAVQQMRWARANGAVAVMLRPFEDDRHLVDPYFYPLYEEASRLDLAVAVHIANASPQLLDRFKPQHDRMGGFAQFRVPTVVTCLSVMMSDLPTIFPRLRWAFVEASAQWVPWVVQEAVRRSGARAFPASPFKAFNIYVTTQTSDDLDWASTAVADPVKKKILDDNPRTLYAL